MYGLIGLCGIAAVVHTLLPVFDFPAWACASALVFIFLFCLSRIGAADFARRNIFIIVFIAFYCGAVYISSLIETKDVECIPVLVIVMKTFFVYNVILLTMSWGGSRGVAFLLGRISSLRLQLYFILLYRGVVHYRKVSRHVYYQVQSRLHSRREMRRLIPRYYVQNIIAKELYAFQHNQAALVARLPENSLSPWTPPRKIKKGEAALMALMGISICAGFVMQARAWPVL